MTVELEGPAPTESTSRGPSLATADEDLALLTGPDAGDLLAAAIASAGGELLTWRPGQVDHRPGTATTVSYRATVRWATGETTETLGASTAPPRNTDHEDQPGVLTLSDGERSVRVWRFPLDPALPGLAKAVHAETLAALINSLGVTESGEDIATQVRAYRPGRRAVIEVTSPTSRLFLKVVRPDRARAIHDRHQLLHDAGLPVPQSLGWSDDGIVALQALTGDPMRPVLLGSGALPNGSAVMGLINRYPDGVLALPRRRSWTGAATHFATVIGSALPEVADQARDLASVILAGTAAATAAAGGADEPCHGDLYESQLLLRNGVISGLLDIDSFGPGRRADDAACMIAHANVLGLMRPHRVERLDAVVADWRAAAEQQLSAAELRYRVAGVLLSLATGPHRVQEPNWQNNTRARLALVAHWVQQAQEAQP